MCLKRPQQTYTSSSELYEEGRGGSTEFSAIVARSLSAIWPVDKNITSLNYICKQRGLNNKHNVEEPTFNKHKT